MASPLRLAWLLSAWRVSAGYTERGVAAELGVTERAIESWELGERTGFDRLRQLDALYKAGGALVGLATALETPSVLETRETWWHNFGSDGGPIWAWIRPAQRSQVAVEAFCGVISLKLRQPCRLAEGIVVNCPVSIDNPPIAIKFMNGDGWVDFGQGKVPDIGLQRVDAGWLFRPFETARHFALNLGSQSEVITSFMKTRRGRLLRPAVRVLVSDKDLPIVRRGFSNLRDTPTAPLQSDSSHLSKDQMAALRLARHMSILDVTKEDALLLKNRYRSLTDNQVETIERGGRPRDAPYVRARLDTIYRASGLTFREQLLSSDIRTTNAVQDAGEPDAPGNNQSPSNCIELHFPEFWVGPIWLRFDANTGMATDVELEWAPWQRSLCVSPGAVVWTRRAKPSATPLVVRMPPGWNVVGGMGTYDAGDDPPVATDVNEDWVVMGNMIDDVFQVMLPKFLQILEYQPRRTAYLLRGLPWMKNRKDRSSAGGPSSQ